MENLPHFLSYLMNQLFYLKYGLYWLSGRDLQREGRLNITTSGTYLCGIKFQSILTADLKIGSVGEGKSFRSTTYLLLPSLSFQFHPYGSSAYCTYCAALPSLHTKPLSDLLSCDMLQSAFHVLNFSHLSLLWTRCFWLLPWVGWLKYFLVIWRMAWGG